MQFKAAILRDNTTQMSVESVNLRELRADEVLVKLVATGVCHSDVAVRDAMFPIPRPVILGHEGSGTVERVGAAVHGLAPGDSVILTYLACGVCPTCRSAEPAYCRDFGAGNVTGLRTDGSSALEQNGKAVGGHFFGQSSFAEYSVANQRNVIKVRADVPLALLGPLGCGVQTGAGSVMNALRPRPGSSLVVFGAGGVGLSAAMAAVVEECKQVIVVEPNAGRRQIAKSVGATHVIDPINNKDLVAELVDISGGGVNYAVDTSGKPEVAQQAFAALAVRGELALVAFYGITPTVSFGLLDFTGKGLKVRGVTEGDAVPADFIPRLVELHMAGRFPLDRLVKYYPLASINGAIEDQASGATIKPIVRIANAT
jgi:aryl-alcohol dehydrogenase